jgi:hypothetical protein
MQINKFFRLSFSKVFTKILCCAFSCLIFSCWSQSDKSGAVTNQANFKLEYTFGTYPASGADKNVYVIWAENSVENFYYPIYICERLLGKGAGPLTHTALPYWKVNKYPKMKTADVDAVTGATKAKQNFSVPFVIPVSAPRQFTVYFETDASNYGGTNSNDWFADQPAMVYETYIDLDNLQAQYTLVFIGWTSNEYTVINENNNNKIAMDIAFNVFHTEINYITKHRDASSTPTSDVFGTDDSNAQSTLYVGSIRVIPQN